MCFLSMPPDSCGKSCLKHGRAAEKPLASDLLQKSAPRESKNAEYSFSFLVQLSQKTGEQIEKFRTIGLVVLLLKDNHCQLAQCLVFQHFLSGPRVIVSVQTLKTTSLTKACAFQQVCHNSKLYVKDQVTN